LARLARPAGRLYLIRKMNSSLAFVLTLGVIAAGSNLIGGAFALLRPGSRRKPVHYGLAFSGGFLLAVALLHILPEAVSLTPRAPIFIVTGYFLVYLAEHAFAGHAHGSGSEPHGPHPLIGPHECDGDGHPVRAGAAWSAAIGLLLHSFFDGAAIAAALTARPATGWLVFLAVALHKIPEGYSMAEIMLNSSASRTTAFSLAAGLGCASLAGTLVTALAITGISGVGGIVLAVAGGMFLHIAATDLLPTTSRIRGLKVMTATLAGAVVVIAFSAFLGGVLPR